MKKFLISLVVIVVIIIAGFQIAKHEQTVNETANQPAGQSLPTFRLAFNTWVGFGPFWLAQEKGFFQKEGVNVNMQVIEDVGQRKNALLQGQIDGIGNDTVDNLVLEKDEGVPAVAVMQADVSNGADGILAGPGINTVADLKGKKVLVQKNFVSEAFLNYVLKTNGLNPTDVQEVDTDAGNAGAAFAAGKAQVAVTYEPWLSKGKVLKGSKVLVSSADAPGVIVDIFSVNQTYLSAHPDVVQKVMRAWFDALDYWKQNPADANAIMAKHYDSTPSDFADLISGLTWPSYDQNVAYFGTPSSPGKISQIEQTFSDIFMATGSIKSKPDMSGSVDSSLLQTLYSK